MQDPTDALSVSTAHGYTKCRFGELHYLMGLPAAPSNGAPPLVLLHQNPSSTDEYAGLLEEMSKDRKTIAFDTPGNGMSQRPDAPPSMAGYAAAFADGLDALGWGVDQKVDVLGFHTGTYLAVELALARPDLVGRVILSGIPFRPADQRAERLATAQAGLPLTEEGDAIFAHLKAMWAYAVTGRDRRVPLQRAVEIFAERIRPMNRHYWPYVGVWSYDAEARLPLLTQPVLILQPHEMLLPHTLKAAELIPDAQVIEMPELNMDVFEVGVPAYAKEIRNWTAMA